MVLRSARGQIRLLAALFAGLLVGGLGAPASAAPGTPSAPAVQPLITWAASADVTFTKVTQQTVRNVVTTSVAGRGLQVSLSNAFGSAPVTFRTVSVGVVQSGATLVPGSSRPVFFGGDPSITVPVGEEVLSDPLPGNVAARQTLAVSVYVDAEVRRATGHNLALTANYLSEPGDHASEDSGSAYTRGLSRWIFLESLVVTQRAAQSTVAALGDSITDGVGSTPGTNRRWTDSLARRLIAAPPNAEKGVANEGISANRVLSGGVGQSVLRRFGRDVLDQPGVETVILLEGINDINTGATAADLIEGYRELIARAHADDTCILGGTLTPNEGGSPAREAERQAVNDFIRNSGEFDGVVDFDAVVRDPSAPTTFRPVYDSGDGLHPSDAGYRAMGNAVPLGLLDCSL